MMPPKGAWNLIDMVNDVNKACSHRHRVAILNSDHWNGSQSPRWREVTNYLNRNCIDDCR